MVAPSRHCHNVPPSTDITGARRLIPDRKNASVVGETDRVKVAGGDGGNVTPCVDRALPTAIVPHGNGAPIGSEAHRMPVAASQRDNLTPLAHVACSLAEPSRGQHGAVTNQPQGAAPARGDKGHVAP
ncbi:hypothetical protein GCM10022226_80400 [Sphaerisporangium flaviroseum]|uniref:Uncharacterized protein n=1 Tax=Sphaerisporangium flaviroseum TaxID=509199 RepID=A0ABP7JHI2_9ACTN